MKLLAIETAFESCSVALRLGAETRERFEITPRGHASLLLPWVEELLGEAGLSLGTLDAVAFSRGPGSFTSLRIGIGVVQGLAFGADLPVIPVSSLRTVAQSATQQGVTRACVAMDARMEEVYSGCFELLDGVMASVGKERVCAPELALPNEPETWSGVGNGMERFVELRETQWLRSLPDCWPRAGHLAELAERDAQHEKLLSPEEAQAVYLRDRVAKKESARP